MNFRTILFLVIFSLFSFFALKSFWSTKTFLSKATPTKGKVVDFVITESYDSEEEEYYNVFYPIVEFKVKGEDRLFQFKSSSGNGRRPSYSINQKINIYYLKLGNSFHGRIDSFFNLWGSTLALSFFGLLAGLLSFIFFKASKKTIKMLHSNTNIIKKQYQ